MSSSLDHHRNGLPTEILYEFFYRLPSLEHIYRFRCVSKLWNSLLSEPSLLNKKFNIIPNPPWFLVYSPANLHIKLCQAHDSKLITEHDGFTFKFLLDTDAFKHLEQVCLLDSCNGLVLCSICSTFDAMHAMPGGMFCICNPLTRQWTLLPPRPIIDNYEFGDYDYSWYYFLVCDQSFSRSTANLTCNFKVVRKSHYQLKYFQIFSFDTGEWDSYEVEWHRELFGPSNGIVSEELVIRNGVLYWVENQLEGTELGGRVLMAYRLENRIKNGDRCRSIDIPEYRDPRYHPTIWKCQRSSNSCLGEVEGSIYYGQIHGTGCNTGYLSFWLLEDDYSNDGLVWRLKHPKIEWTGYGPSQCMDFMCLNLLDQDVVIIVDRGCYLVCNITTKTFEKLPGCPISVKDRLVLITPKPTIITDWKKRHDEGGRGGGYNGQRERWAQ